MNALHAYRGVLEAEGQRQKGASNGHHPNPEKNDTSIEAKAEESPIVAAQAEQPLSKAAHVFRVIGESGSAGLNLREILQKLEPDGVDINMNYLQPLLSKAKQRGRVINRDGRYSLANASR